MVTIDPPNTPATDPAGPAGRNAGIVVVCGLAILLVVTHHTALRIPLRATALAAFVPRRVLGVFGYCGYESVFVSFVVSGFLITGNTLRRCGTLDRLAWRPFAAPAGGAHRSVPGRAHRRAAGSGADACARLCHHAAGPVSAARDPGGRGIAPELV
jgi:hypothetical protein